ncbi:MAG: NUDIX hydrolase [Candidatus Pacearchaeota archaeon]
MTINYTPGDLIDHHAVSAVIKNSEGDILMQDHVKYGFWTIPIGKAEPNQDPIEAIKQEAFEECNLMIKELKEIAYKEVEYERNENNIKAFTHVYEIISYSGELQNKEPHKHNEQKFMSLEEIKKIPYLSDSTIFFLESLGFKRDARLD